MTCDCREQSDVFLQMVQDIATELDLHQVIIYCLLFTCVPPYIFFFNKVVVVLAVSQDFGECWPANVC